MSAGVSSELVLELLDACLRGEEPRPETLAAIECYDSWPASWATAVHELHHFLDDQDIRARDPEHAAYWNRRLRALRDRL